MRNLPQLLAVALGLLPVPVLAQKQSLVPFLPKDTVVAISVPDLDASIGEFSQMPLAKMWREEEVQNFVRDAQELARQQLDKLLAKAKEMHAQGAFPVDPDKLMNLRLHAGTLAVTRLELKEGEFGPMPRIGLLLHLDFGETAEQWFGLLRMLLGMLEQAAGDDVERKESMIGDAQVIAMLPKNGPPGLEMSLNVAMVKTGIVIATLEEDLRTTLEGLQSGKTVLAATDRYQSTAKHLQTAGAEAEVYMRTDLCLDFAVQALGVAAKMEQELAWLDAEGLARAFDALGLRGIRSIGGTSTYQDGKAASASYVVAPAPDRKGLLAGANKNLDLGFLKWVPKDAVSFTGLTMEPMSVYDALVAALKAYDEEIAKQALGHLEGIEQNLKFSIRDDFFGALGDTLITWSMPMATAMSTPEMAVLVKVKDHEKLLKVVKSLTSLSDGMVELDESEKQGVKTYQFRVNFDPTGGMGGMNPFDIINPTFAFKEGYLVAGFSPSDIRRVFKRMERTDDDPKSDIRGNKEYARYAQTVPENVQSLSFTDWKAEFEGYYQILTSVLAFVPMSEDVPIDMSLLPDVATLTQHLFGSIGYSTADGNGFAGKSISPFGPEVGLLAVAGILAGVGAYAAFSARR